MSANTSGYKAAVCIFLYGGNQSAGGWVIPVTAAKRAEYANTRGALAVPSANVLPLNGTASDGNQYGLNRSPELQALWNAGKAAIICNVGTLIRPTNAAAYKAGSAILPPQLYSHFNQQQQWMTAYSSSGGTVGWGGRLADQLISEGYKPNLSTVISAGSGGNQQCFGTGNKTSTYVLGTNGATAINTIGQNNAAANTLNTFFTMAANDSSVFVQAYGAIAESSISKVGIVSAALKAANTFSTATFSDSPVGGSLGSQLQVVAKLIKAQANIGDARQLFFVSCGGFDTHNGELNQQASLLPYISGQIQQFHNALVESGQNNNVVVFTNSEFGRTLVPNNDGSDHGWGGHSMVIGDMVKGGYYGTMPSLVSNGPDDADGTGRLVPTTSVDQYAATIANWLGADATLMNTLFPDLQNFSPPLLGFL